MKLAIALLALNLFACAAGAGPQRSSSHPGAAQPSIIRDGGGGGAKTDSGNGSGGTPIPVPHPNV